MPIARTALSRLVDPPARGPQHIQRRARRDTAAPGQAWERGKQDWEEIQTEHNDLRVQLALRQVDVEKLQGPARY